MYSFCLSMVYCGYELTLCGLAATDVVDNSFINELSSIFIMKSVGLVGDRQQGHTRRVHAHNRT